MKFILRLFGLKERKIHSDKSPVYTFFVEANADVKTKAYRKALKGASKDQMQVLSKYDKQFAHIK